MHRFDFGFDSHRNFAPDWRSLLCVHLAELSNKEMHFSAFSRELCRLFHMYNSFISVNTLKYFCLTICLQYRVGYIHVWNTETKKIKPIVIGGIEKIFSHAKRKRGKFSCEIVTWLYIRYTVWMLWMCYKGSFISNCQYIFLSIYWLLIPVIIYHWIDHFWIILFGT